MSLTGGHLDALLAAGATAEQIVALVKADIAEQEKRLVVKREKDAERQRRKRGHAESRGVTRTKRDTPDGSPKENNQTPSLPPAEVSEPSGSSPQPRAWALPVGVSLQVWTDLLTNRKRKRLPNTDTAWKGFLEDLERVSIQTGIPPPKLVEQCTAKGWGAIYDPKGAENGRSTNGMGRNQPSSDGLSSTGRAGLSVFGPG